MTTRTTALGLLICSLVACADSRHGAHIGEAKPQVRLASSAPPFRSDCEADTTAIHSDPRALLEEALSRNARGEQAYGGWIPWWDGASECPDNAPGWDTAILVTGWRVDSLSGSRDSVRFTVQFAELGSMAPPRLKLDPRTRIDTVTLVRVATGRRLASYGLDLFLFPATVRPKIDDTTHAAHVLDAIIAAKPR